MTTTDEARVTDELVLDCGDNSCLFAQKRGGMRTNGGCRCLKDLDHEPHRRVDVARYIKGLVDRLAARAEEYAASVNDLSEKLAARDSEVARLRSERAEVVALLEDVDSAIDCDVLQFGRDGDCALLPEKTCWGHRRIALLTKLRGTP